MTRRAIDSPDNIRRAREVSQRWWRESLLMTLALLAGVTILIAARWPFRVPLRFGRHSKRDKRLPRDLLAVLAHELRTPLNSIVGWTHVLESGQADESVTATALRSIASSAQTQRRLIDDIMDAMRAEEHEIRMRMEVIDLRAPLRSAVDVIRPSAESGRLFVSLALPSMICPVSGDSERLQQAFGNLLANAVKFTSEGGIQVSLVRRHHEYEVHIVDTGRGIDRDFLPLVFKRFKQADRSGRRNDGLGLGLAICRDLIEQHHGRINVDSSGHGQGTTVVVSLPGLHTAPTIGDSSS